MISSINDIYRKKIYEKNNIYSIFSYLSRLNEPKRDYILRLIISDWYKFNYVVNGESSPSILSDGVEQVLDLFKNNPEFLLTLYKSSIAFYYSEIISKITVMDKISENHLDKKMCDISKFHVLDKISYTFSYDLDDFNIYYLDYMDKNKKNKEDKNAIFYYLVNRMVKLYNTNPSMYADKILKIMGEYYKWVFYNINVLNAIVDNQNVQYLDIIKKFQIGDLVNYSIWNKKFLETLISEYLYNENFSSESDKVNSKRILINSTSPDFQKKLKITAN